MKLLRTIILGIAAALWFLFGGALGAAIFSFAVISYGLHQAGGEPMNAGEEFALGWTGIFAGVFGFIVGISGAIFLWGKRSFFERKLKLLSGVAH